MDTTTTRPTTEQTPPPSVIQEVGRHAISGATCGSLLSFFDGATSSPSGSRLSGGALAVPKNALKIGTFAACFGVAKSVRCAVAPDYPFETTVSMGVTEALFTMRHGLRAAGRSGLIAAAAVGMIADLVEYGLSKRSGA